MIEFGKSLRAAREAKGLSVRQLAEMTRMAPTTVQELESENFSRIAAPIYGRGFVKLYCKAVGLDSKLFVDEFMDLYSGNRDTIIRERPPQSASPETDAPPVVSAPEPPRSSAVPPPPPPPAAEPDLFQQAQTETVASVDDVEPPRAPLSRYASPIRQNRAMFDRRVFLRVGLLSACALFALSLVVVGLRAVYRATTNPDKEENVVQEIACATPSEAAKTIPAAGKTPRTPLKIPSLYID